MKNKPYVQKLGRNNIILNPITKYNPYLHKHLTTRQKKENLKEFKDKPLTHYVHCVSAYKVHKENNKIKKVSKIRNKYGIPFYTLKKSKL